MPFHYPQPLIYVQEPMSSPSTIGLRPALLKKIPMVIYGNVWYLYDTLWCLMVFFVVFYGIPVVFYGALWYSFGNLMVPNYDSLWSPMVQGIIGSPQDTGTI